jgi:hypothetical protein
MIGGELRRALFGDKEGNLRAGKMGIISKTSFEYVWIRL